MFGSCSLHRGTNREFVSAEFVNPPSVQELKTLRLWAFVLSVKDTCGAASDVESRQYAFMCNRNEMPCCLPEMCQDRSFC